MQTHDHKSDIEIKKGLDYRGHFHFRFNRLYFEHSRLAAILQTL